MKTTIQTLARSFALLTLAFSLGVFAGCDKQTKSSDSPDSGEKKENLCTDYSTCDECIAGQQAKGKELGAAETECGAAVIGCWTTWEKPITCSGKEMKNEEAAAD